MRPAIAPGDPRAALELVADKLHLLPTGSPVANIWLRDAIREWLTGRADTLDEALGLPPPQPRQVQARARAELLARLGVTTGVTSTWGQACAVSLLLKGRMTPRPDQEELVAQLRADEKTARGERHIFRLLQVRPADTTMGVCVSTPRSAPMPEQRRRKAS